MDQWPRSAPDFSHIRPLLLAMARERSSERVLRLTVERLASANNIAVARIWLAERGDLCELCANAGSCADRTRCLHLVATACEPGHAQLDGAALATLSPRVPLKRSGPCDGPARGEPVVIDLASTDPLDSTDPEVAPLAWARELGLGGVCVQPMLHHDELLGALEVMTFGSIPEEGPEWLRVIADHAAAALATSHAFEEIQRLRRELVRENKALKAEIQRARPRVSMIGGSPATRLVMEQVELVAPTQASVLLLGESGTGKELLAHEIHRRSSRADRTLVIVNCASIPRDLYESEFFGHRAGAFTGAASDRVGRFEVAHRSTLFLDEVGELPLETQAKLLRVLQEGHYERVGESEPRATDVRIIAATNRDLASEVERGRFRRDLFYRLNVFPIEVPPLRERKEDIPLLAKHFVEQHSAELGQAVPKLPADVIAQLCEYEWPGNVRELRNLLERSVILARDGRLRIDLRHGERRTTGPRSTPATAGPDLLSETEVRDLERRNLLLALSLAGGKISGPGGAADRLGVKATTLASRVRRLGLRIPRG